MPYLSQIAVRRIGGPRPWQLLEDLPFLDATGPVPDRVFTTPAGYRTDFATIPRLLTIFVPKLGPWDEPAATHDLGCDALRDQWAGERANRLRAERDQPLLEVRQPWLDSPGVDQLWRRALRSVGVGPVLTLLLWVAVRWGALASPWRRRGWWSWRETPLVLTVTAVVLTPLVLLLPLAVRGLLA